ncbi:D-alanyl-D-alanine carboxypeptidase/D-alanyl-D-alanine-endopeptidase [Chitinophaga niabensis]|uniref:D-alanyl-D-alanine carboxypeptidase / D-alanyl-D-alanine-endopeptidase (Penicillin-binding protein 4) n=1 Tax=Chitinophaga niabensis TaxID=536979 RepID=A0A1N6JLX8_9BACT|nr:D-alanyl-D-alanine carboxypeptidase [Chitinophaga niabensis]SIO45355.1 D-alanyl-D-alanine carboxypeptidase / D-alanyl-D-alanine-endopeptidase (penicillin-binding protein 4) [Chitinophaga niabensis]
MRSYLLLVAVLVAGAAAAQPKNIRQWATQDVLDAKALTGAHVGISIMDPATGKYWIQYQDDKFFMPASNTKIFTLFTGLQLLGDSLPGMRFSENDTAIYIQGTADPSFLHPDFTAQRVKDLLTQTDKRIWYQPAVIKNKRFGPGWAWSDYADYYQPELNELPMYGNVARIKIQGSQYSMVPEYPTRSGEPLPNEVLADREERANEFVLHFRPENRAVHDFEVPFITGGNEQLLQRLQDTLHKQVGLLPARAAGTGTILKSIPVDTLFQPMMHRSDNFFAEQILMMCSSVKWDTIDSRKVIGYMLDSTLKDLPHPPSWVDGSGLSRYNLFTPRDFVTVLNKLYKTYPKERLYPLFPTGGKGTLRNYYQALPGRLYAKTGTLSGCVALSGFFVNKSGKTLIFSVLVNNHNSTSTAVRRAVETFLVRVANN